MQNQNPPQPPKREDKIPAPSAGGRGIDAPLPTQGGQTSISPPANVNPTPLASGIDTLYLAIDVNWTASDFLNQLQNLKEQAKETEKPVLGLIADWPFLVQPFGRRGYEWILDSREFSWRVGNWEKPKSRPSVIAEIRSETLWHLGAKSAVHRVLSLLNYASQSDLQNPTIESVKVSRADLCLDLLLPENLWLSDLRASIVSRAQNIRTHYKSIDLTGLSIGAGAISARLYDKPLEIRTKSKKDWMFKIWNLDYAPPNTRVIRVEFQILREVLKELKIDTPEDLFRLESNVWSYCTQSWLKFQDRPGTHHTQRNTLPWWESVQTSYKGAQAASPLIRTKAYRSDQIQLIRQAYGLLSSLTALQMEEMGEDISVSADFNDCLSALFESVGLLGENNDFGMRVLQKRARYHRTQQQTTHIDYFEDKGGNHAKD